MKEVVEIYSFCSTFIVIHTIHTPSCRYTPYEVASHQSTWHNEGTPFGPIVLQGATGIQLPGTGTATASKGQCVTGACYLGKHFFLMYPHIKGTVSLVIALCTPIGICTFGISSARYPTEPINPHSRSLFVGTFQFRMELTFSVSIQIPSLSTTSGKCSFSITFFHVFLHFEVLQNAKTQNAFFFFQVHQRIIIMCLVFILGIRVYCYIYVLI